MLGYSWAWTFGLYHPCISPSGLTHALEHLNISEYIIEFWALWLICLILLCCEVILMGQSSKPSRLQVQPRLWQGRALSWVPL